MNMPLKERLIRLVARFEQNAKDSARSEEEAYGENRLGAAMSYSASASTWNYAAEDLRQALED